MSMHWVKATAPDGRPAYVNLAAMKSMMRDDASGMTILFLGGMAVDPTAAEGARVRFANTQVKETPAELFLLPRIVSGGGHSVLDAEPAKVNGAAPRKSKLARKARETRARA